jgi:4-hydroxybenzoate polyprenyltransferase
LNTTSIIGHPAFSRLKLFMALSRTPHGLLDMATPALGALLWLGGMPSPAVILLGFLTAFAGYTAVYALNDVVDYRSDKEKIRTHGLSSSSNDLDAIFVRHPMAQGLLSYREGIIWTVVWGSIALVGAYMLNPACAFVFIGGCLAEAGYCLLLRVSTIRTAVSGAVKTAGGVAAVFAVATAPSFTFLLSIFIWLFLWEVGGQNVPNDWSDLNEDRALDAETIPVRLGPEKSSLIILGSLVAAVLASILLYWTTPATLHPFYFVGALVSGTILLLLPALQLYRTKSPQQASILFNRASYYPLAMLLVVLVSSVGPF